MTAWGLTDQGLKARDSELARELQKQGTALMATKIDRNISKSKFSLARDERGLSTVEYVILLVVVAVAGIFLWNKLGETVMTKVQDSDSRLGGDLDTQKTTPTKGQSQ
jgi:Flp pilus assembly pilin Flp